MAKKTNGKASRKMAAAAAPRSAESTELPRTEPAEDASGGPLEDSSTKVFEGTRFPIVDVGASAGGLEAFTQLLENLPPSTGMAYVLIQHLDPTHASQLAEILSRKSPMP